MNFNACYHPELICILPAFWTERLTCECCSKYAGTHLAISFLCWSVAVIVGGVPARPEDAQ